MAAPCICRPTAPLPGYQLARADIERGANHRTVAEPQKRSFLASLFSRDKDAEETDDSTTARETAPRMPPSPQAASTQRRPHPDRLAPSRS